MWLPSFERSLPSILIMRRWGLYLSSLMWVDRTVQMGVFYRALWYLSLRHRQLLVQKKLLTRHLVIEQRLAWLRLIKRFYSVFMLLKVKLVRHRIGVLPVVYKCLWVFLIQNKQMVHILIVPLAQLNRSILRLFLRGNIPGGASCVSVYIWNLKVLGYNISDSVCILILSLSVIALLPRQVNHMPRLIELSYLRAIVKQLLFQLLHLAQFVHVCARSFIWVLLLLSINVEMHPF